MSYVTAFDLYCRGRSGALIAKLGAPGRDTGTDRELLRLNPALEPRLSGDRPRHASFSRRPQTGWIVTQDRARASCAAGVAA